jgi:hypothetical protein
MSPALEATVFLVAGPILLAVGRHEWRRRRTPEQTLAALGYDGAEWWNAWRRGGSAVVLFAIGTLCVVGGLVRAVTMIVG